MLLISGKMKSFFHVILSIQPYDWTLHSSVERPWEILAHKKLFNNSIFSFDLNNWSIFICCHDLEAKMKVFFGGKLPFMLILGSIAFNVVDGNPLHIKNGQGRIRKCIYIWRLREFNKLDILIITKGELRARRINNDKP